MRLLSGNHHKRLAKRIRDLDAAGDAAANPDRRSQEANELRPYVNLWHRLEGLPKAEPSPGAQERGRERILAHLSSVEPGRRRRRVGAFGLGRAAATATASFVALLLVAGGVAGASSALGGPDVAQELFSGLGVDNDNASETGQEHANPNASDGADNAGQGMDNASETGQQHANPNASDGADNAGQGMDNASQTGQQHANPNASDGADNAGQGADSASQTGQQDANPNASDGADNAGQGADNAPDTGQQSGPPNH